MMRAKKEIETIDKLTKATGQEAVADKEETGSAKGKVAALLVTGILAVSITLCVAVCVQVLSKGYVSIGGFSLFRVVTGSMEPEIPVGSLLIAKKAEITDIEVGDIVVFKSRESRMLGMVITHRVVATHVGTDGGVLLETKGDANQYADGYFVEAGNLIGKALYYTGGTNVFTGIFGLLSNKVGFMACVVLPCLVCGMLAMRDCVKNLKIELENVTRELDAEEAADVQPVFTEEEYRELCERLKRELLEELKQGVTDNQTTQEHTTE